jgi:hypothetical protein
MDAADAYAYISLIPPENCNGTAIVIKKETFHPVEIKQNQIYGAHKKYNLALTGDGDLSGGGSFTFNDYAAYAKRWEIGKSGGEQAFFEKWVAKHPGANLSKHTLGALDSLDMPLTIQFEGSFNGNVEKAGNLLLVSPWVFDQNTENPFASVTRAYPVEFNYPYVQSTSAEIVIPEGYVVETLPKNIKVRLPDGSARFTFTANQKGNTITVTHAVQITRTMYSAEEYGDLRNFYQTVLDKELEKIILKKA